MGRIAKNDGWRLDDKPWERIEPLLPPRKAHPLGCHRPRAPEGEREQEPAGCSASDA